MLKSKYVRNWFVTKDPNNIYTLVINTTERWCNCFKFGEDGEKYLFQISQNKDEDIINDDIVLEIPKFLPDLNEGHYLESYFVEKDQIYYYFIPYLYKWIKNGDKIVLKSEDYK